MSLNQRKKFIRSFLVMGGSEGIRGLVMIISTAYLARVLGAQRYGILGFGQGVYVYFALLANFGFEWVGARLAARGDEQARRDLHTVVLLKAIAAGTSFAAMLTFCGVVALPQETRHVLLCYAAGVAALGLLTDWYFYGRQSFGALLLGRLLGQGILLVCVFGFVRADRPTWLYPALFSGAGVLAAIFFFVLFCIRAGAPRPSVAWPDARRLLRAGSSMFLSLLLTQGVLNMSLVVLALWESEQRIGYYTAAQRLAFGALYQGCTLLGLAFFPLLSRAFHDDKAEFRSVLRAFVIVGSVAAAAIACLAMLLGGSLVEGLFSSAYSGSVSVFKLLALAVACAFVDAPFSYAMISAGRESLVLLKWSIAAAADVALHLILVPRFGIEGAAVANLVSMALGLVVAVACCRLAIRRALAAPTVFGSGRAEPTTTAALLKEEPA